MGCLPELDVWVNCLTRFLGLSTPDRSKGREGEEYLRELRLRLHTWVMIWTHGILDEIDRLEITSIAFVCLFGSLIRKLMAPLIMALSLILGTARRVPTLM